MTYKFQRTSSNFLIIIPWILSRKLFFQTDCIIFTLISFFEFEITKNIEKYEPAETPTAKGLFGIATPAKKTLTEWSPSDGRRILDVPHVVRFLCHGRLHSAILRINDANIYDTNSRTWWWTQNKGKYKIKVFSIWGSRVEIVDKRRVRAHLCINLTPAAYYLISHH